MTRAAFCLSLLLSVAMRGNAELLVSDRATNQILRYDSITGELLGPLVAGDPANNGGLIAPSAMSLGPNGELFVASQFTGAVLRYDLESGDFLGEFAGQLNGPSGLLYDESRDRLLVSTLGNFDSELIIEFEASTGELRGPVGTGTGPTGRTAIALGPDGNLYVSSFANDEFFSGSVLQFDADTLEGGDTFAAGPGLAGANGLTFRQNGDAFSLDVVGLFSSTLVRFDVAANESDELVATSSNIIIGQGLDFPSDVIDLTEDRMLVSNLGNDNPETGDLTVGSIGRYDIANGEFIDTFIEGSAEGFQPTSMLLLGRTNLDCNGDGIVDQQDVECACNGGVVLSELLSAIGSTVGDLDLDGQVAFSDFLVLSSNFDRVGSYQQGDLDCDGHIRFADFLVLAEAFGDGTVAAVPEPDSLWCVLLSVIVMVTRRRCLVEGRASR